jgi:hypothetical protein
LFKDIIKEWVWIAMEIILDARSLMQDLGIEGLRD